MANLISEHDVPPYNIIAVTFTNKATQEMKARLKGLLGNRADKLWAATFHSTALRILRRHAELLSYSHDFVVYDSQDSKSVVKNLIKDMNIDEKRYPPAFFLKAIDRAKL